MKFYNKIKNQSSTSISSAAIPDGSQPNGLEQLSLWREWNTSDLPESKQQNIPFEEDQVTQIKHLYTHRCRYLHSLCWQMVVVLQPPWLCLDCGQGACLTQPAWKLYPAAQHCPYSPRDIEGTPPAATPTPRKSINPAACLLYLCRCQAHSCI